MSHLHLRCLDLVDERGQPGDVEYSPDADSGPADNEIAAAILARAAAIFQRGPPVPAHAICRTIVAKRRPRGSLGFRPYRPTTDDHPEIGGKVTRRLARWLVRDSKYLTIRELSRRHRLSWGLIMGLVRSSAAVVGARRRARAGVGCC
jgi:hypothetical protein